jgi:hypothetical protein
VKCYPLCAVIVRAKKKYQTEKKSTFKSTD